MYVLIQMKDTVRIPPRFFQLDTVDAIREALNKKLANKVVYNVGLCIALWDIEKIEDSFIFPGDGATHTIDEILTGKIKSCRRDGIHVSMAFFDDILIPADSLQHPSKFNEQEQIWSWIYEAGEDGTVDLHMDIGGEIRFRVVDEMFVDTTPTDHDSSSSNSSVMPPPPTPSSSTSMPVTDPSQKKAPYTIVGSISEMGLGMLSWWNS